MIVNCPSCNSRYLVNSADLQPKGRIVHCTICSYEWFNDANLNKEGNDSLSQEKINKDDYEKKLPSTYVQENDVSITNSFLTIAFIILLVFLYYFLKNADKSIIFLFMFYLEEMIINLNIFIDSLVVNIKKILG
ncbi:MAG: hypothetical protein CFH21_00084 [Alphaproteobacteria bacterium MarineAlpha5_Bin11]|nr:hypothetical protein [Pelagibacteraceae bacterium]PPR44995.1 MAG: hypothetical protein CFH21_00084 [Alphaproteobacteria bacterium MarineAlpha5_Bin11]PPR51401.1 MAG: hypothetical protein CFH20_00594 [Alphaproteobacteria bacterium MarineAlpha5_Bin10]|tara:strand:+ start:38598 stop:38999 length:402 start_codon:yes stop_codon:yes gene_type:complete